MSRTVKYGLITGLGVCGWFLLEFALGFHTTRPRAGEYSSYFSSLILFGMLFLLLRARQQESDRPLPLGPSLQAGLTASLVTALVVYSFMVVFNQLLNPGWIDAALEWKVEQLRTQGTTEPAIRDQIRTFRHLNSPRGLLLSIGVVMTLMGTIFSYGITLYLRHRCASGGRPQPAGRFGPQ